MSKNAQRNEKLIVTITNVVFSSVYDLFAWKFRKISPLKSTKLMVNFRNRLENDRETLWFWRF